MTCLTLTYVTAVMCSVSLVCAIVLGAILKKIGGYRLKKLSHSNNTGKEIFKLNLFGSVVFLFVQTLIFWVILSLGLGKDNFA